VTISTNLHFARNAFRHFCILFLKHLFSLKYHAVKATFLYSRFVDTLWNHETYMYLINFKSFNCARVGRWHIFKPKIPIWVNFEGSCTFYGHVAYSMVIWYSFPVLVSCTKKNLAALNSTKKPYYYAWNW
jgi:hypothetical protein